MLAEKLNMSPDDAEKWIVNLIRNARLDAKIDSKLVSHAQVLLKVRMHDCVVICSDKYAAIADYITSL